ncbi:MAG: flagellar motor switch protein FliM [Congregibacter sp.]
MANDEVLTEGEIDALMESVDEAPTGVDASDDGEFRRFDFGGREHSLLREFTAFSSLLERQAELLASAFENAFSLEFLTRSTPVELISVGDALASLERVVGVTTTTLAPLNGPVFVITPSSLLPHVVNAYFGGGKTAAPSGDERAALTPTELRVAERIAGLYLSSMCEAWMDKLPIEAGDTATLGVPDRLEMVPRTDLLLRLRFSLSAGDFEANLDLLLPFVELEPYRERFAPPKKKDEVDPGDSWEPFFRRELPTIEVEVAAVLASRSLTLAELLQLRTGSVISMPAPEQVFLQVEDTVLAEGRYGSYEGAKAVQLERLASVLRSGS